MKKIAKAYGKINLSLAITGRRENGYHNLLTVMQSISVYNTITVENTENGLITLTSDDKNLPTDEKNTAYRAARLFLEKAALPENTGLRLHIQKRIPYQAGMGSASADAAGVLAASNELFGSPLSERELISTAASVGADVPFCLKGGCCLAEGIGDILTPIDCCPDCALLIVHPETGMSTPEAYRIFDSLSSPMQPNVADTVSALKSGSIEAVAESCGNVFELCCEVDDVFAIKRELRCQNALAACMTGSGTAVFGIFRERNDAESAERAVSAPNRKILLAFPVKKGVIIE